MLRKYTFTLSLVLLVLLGTVLDGGIFGIETAHAATTGTVPASENMFTTTIRLSSMIITVLEFLAFIVFYILQYLLDPEFIIQITTESEGDILNAIWRFSRDLMNVLFAVLLVAMGVVTVITNNKEWVTNYFKKFIIGVILVNFSWFFAMVILDASNILTATIYQIPAEIVKTTGKAKCEVPKWDSSGAMTTEKCQIYTDFWFFSACRKQLSLPDTHPNYVAGVKTAVGKIVCYTTKDYDDESNTALGILNGLVANHGRLGNLARVLNPDSGSGSGTTTDRLEDFFFFLIHTVFVLVLHLMLSLPLIAMFVAFLVRIPIIWLTIAFMPFMFLGFVFGDKIPKVQPMQIFNKFLAAAFLPAAVAIPLAAGFILLNAGAIQPPPGFASDLSKDMGPMLLNVNNIWGILWLFMSFAVIWIGFFTAMSIDNIYQSATNGIKGFGESIGKFAVKTPLSLPILPLPKGDGKVGQSVFGAMQSFRALDSKISYGGSLFDKKGKVAAGGGGDDKGLARELSKPNSPIVQKLTTIAQQLRRENRSSGGYTQQQLVQRLEAEKGNDKKFADALNSTGASIGDVVQAAKTSSNATLRNAVKFKSDTNKKT